MARLTIAHLRPPDAAATAGGATHQLSVSATTAMIVVALIGIVPAFTTIVVDWAIKSPMAGQVQQADINVKAAETDAKKATIRFEERRLEEAWLRSALSIADDKKRAEALKFLVSAGLVTNDFKKIGEHANPPQLVTPVQVRARNSRRNSSDDVLRHDREHGDGGDVTGERPPAAYASRSAGRSSSQRLRRRGLDAGPITFRVELLSMRMSIPRAIASLVRSVLVAGVVAFAVGPQAVLAQEATQSREARARSFIDLMAGGQYAQAFELFTPQMKAAMPVDRLSATWNGLTAQAGPFQRQIATSIVPRGVLSVVVVTCAFERATFDVHVTVNPANLVGGLAVRPAVQAVTYAPPPYASPAAYKESEVTVGTGQWALPATLTMPVAPGPVPAVVLVHGSGPGDRDATVGQIKQFKDLALGLASRGIAVLRYDKRTRVHAQPDARPARSHRQGRSD